MGCKSIVIFGKGKSLLRCDKKMIDEYEDIAICNYPVLNNNFSKLIEGKNIIYHFANCYTFDSRYNDEVNKQLGIKNIINTNSSNSNIYKNYLKDKTLFTENIREYYLTYFKNNYELDPSTGIMALQYIIDLKTYKNIMLVGYDNFEKNKQMYYYEVNEMNDKMKYLINNNTIAKNGELNIISGHSPAKTEQYLYDIIKTYSDINFKIISDIEFKYNNVNLEVI